MPTKSIILEADNIDGAAEQIIHLLEGTDKGGDIIYFHGWEGWGASAVLKEVVKRLRSSLGSADTGTAGGLEKIIHVDLSRWQSKRALQKAIARELELPEQVMAVFDQRDEEDDWDGVEQSARDAIPLVNLAIMKELSDRRFLVVLHNGSGGYIDLWEVGVPVIRQVRKRVLWTSRGRFRNHVTARHDEDEDDAKESAGLSDVAIRADLASGRAEDLRHIVYAEIEEVAKYTGVPEPDMSPKIVTECLLYMAARGNDQGINWESHASNYWVCDGIIHDATDGGRSAWEISDALQRNMNLDLCNGCAEDLCEIWGGEQERHIGRWVSATSQNSKEVQMPPQATSFFCTAGGPSSSTGHNGTSILEADMFEHSDRTSSLRVIHLSHCTFSFSSPPFLGCGNLRFLLLDHCKNNDAHYLGAEKEPHHHSQQDGRACFRNLWVLELSYTDWYWLLSKETLDMMVDLRELNVKGFGDRSMMHLRRCSGAGSNRHRLIKLRVVAHDSTNASDYDDGGTSGNSRNQQVSPPPVVASSWFFSDLSGWRVLKTDGGTSGNSRNQQVSPPPVVASSWFFPDLSGWHVLKTVILDGCSHLEQIDCSALPLSLESFTWISSVTATNKMESISFRGCAKLKHLLLRGLFGRLEELDMSGTAITTLDLSATQAWGLRRLFLLGCEKLCAILWPPREGYEKIWLDILRIDTTTTTYAAWDTEEGKSNKQEATASHSASIGSSSVMVGGKDRTIISSDSHYISVRDPRLFRSLVSSSFGYGSRLHVKISSTGPGHKKRFHVKISSTDDDANAYAFIKDSLVIRSKWLWDCPSLPDPVPYFLDDARNCYISIQDDETQIELLQGVAATSTRELITRATTLPPLVNEDAVSLHLHDSLSITCLPGPAPAAEADLSWSNLYWCRLERCPNLEGVVFIAPQLGEVRNIFQNLRTFWASQLPKARYIWNWSTTSPFRPGQSSFGYLEFLHLDYCPRLVHVLPLYTSNTQGCRCLETLEIVCCGDLREVFPSVSESQQQEEPREFPSLKCIHLHDLPKLQRICGRRMLAPSLETVKMRGCWGLKRLPAVRPLSTVELDCEKDWWDNLEWDGEEAGHHPSRYKPTYSSAYYKKKQLRASVLR